MHDTAGFHAAVTRMRPSQRATLLRRCQGLSQDEVARQDGVKSTAIRARLGVIYRRLRERTASLQDVREQGMGDATCYHLGYEAALQDIERQMAARRAQRPQVRRGVAR